MNITQDTKTETSKFSQQLLSDVKSLFLQEKDENLSPYLYSTANPEIKGDLADGEGCYYRLISQNPGYYLYKEEIELFNNVAGKLAAYVPSGANVIELGPGTDIAFKNKTLPFLKEIKKLGGYIPIDLCQTYLDDSEAILKQNLPEVSVTKIKSDFIKNIGLVGDFDLPVIFFKGSTITNLSTKNCLSFLQRVAQSLTPEGLLIVGVDANQNEVSLGEAYNDGKMADLTLSIVHLINRDLPVEGFDPMGFKYEFNWEPKTHCVEHNVRAIKSQDFVLDGTPIKIEDGTKFHFLSSYKYPVDYFQNLAVEAGLKPLDCFVHEKGRMVIHVLGNK